jgi:hypothetical protein
MLFAINHFRFLGGGEGVTSHTLVELRATKTIFLLQLSSAMWALLSSAVSVNI